MKTRKNNSLLEELAEEIFNNDKKLKYYSNLVHNPNTPIPNPNVMYIMCSGYDTGKGVEKCKHPYLGTKDKNSGKMLSYGISKLPDYPGWDNLSESEKNNKIRIAKQEEINAIQFSKIISNYIDYKTDNKIPLDNRERLFDRNHYIESNSLCDYCSNKTFEMFSNYISNK